MRGRPKRIEDEDLVDDIKEACAASGASYSAFAISIGCSPSTLLRSMSEKAFSRGLADRVRKGLGGGAAMRAVRRRRVGRESADEFLLLLQKLVELAPRVSAAVQVALDPNRTKE